MGERTGRHPSLSLPPCPAAQSKMITHSSRIRTYYRVYFLRFFFLLFYFRFILLYLYALLKTNGRKAPTKGAGEKDKDLLNNYLVFINFYYIEKWYVVCLYLDRPKPTLTHLPSCSSSGSTSLAHSSGATSKKKLWELLTYLTDLTDLSEI